MWQSHIEIKGHSITYNSILIALLRSKYGITEVPLRVRLTQSGFLDIEICIEPSNTVL